MRAPGDRGVEETERERATAQSYTKSARNASSSAAAGPTKRSV